jgi:hypothetical protein
MKAAEMRLSFLHGANVPSTDIRTIRSVICWGLYVNLGGMCPDFPFRR